MSRGIFRMSFRINGSGAGLVVGVADASESAKGMPASDVRAWGLHLSHGALYTKKAGSEKGTLSTKQLVPAMAPLTPEEDPDAGFVENVFDVEVEVNMDRRKLAFGLPGGPLVEAPAKLTSAVRPWAYLWNEADSVMLGSRPPPREGSTGCRKVRTLIQREEPTTAAPKPLRARKTATLSPPDGYTVTGAPSPPAKLVRAASHAAVNDYLPPYAYTEYTEQRKTARQSARAARKALHSARRAVALTLYTPTDRMQASSPPPRPPPSKTATGEKVVGAQEQGGSVEPQRPEPSSGISFTEPAPGSATTVKSLGTAFRSARARTGSHSPRSPRGKGVTHMWDVVKFVSGVYGDVHKQVD